MQETSSQPRDGRDETVLERSDRNLAELLQEVRVVQTGIITVIAVTAGSTAWYIMPLARRRTLEPPAGVELRATRRPDAA